MNFFDHQENARRQSRWIVLSFIGITALIVLAVNLVVLAIFAGQAVPDQTLGAALSSADFLSSQSGLIAMSSGSTAGVIGLASMGKILSLRQGGGKVAQSMGGTLVTPDTKDPLRRRLYNVVEEIAIASGINVPEVYVLENEPAINAFAAGYTNSDAAVAVTQGTLEKLNRSELQGVIAHEFSHIFNGDMRINIRMMGVIFGILVIAIIGRKFLQSRRYAVSSSRDNSAAAIMGIGLALTAIGYIGLFFARWMKSALSRQREYLADASSVQFTRDPDGIAGALKKIAAYGHSSYLKQDPEEVSHMLFSAGFRGTLFATHPPLKQRILRVQKDFKAEEIEALAKKLRAQEQREHTEAMRAQAENEAKPKTAISGASFDVNAWVQNIGNPDLGRILAAAVLTAELPSALHSAAHSIEWAPEVVFYTLMDPNQELRELQLRVIQQYAGDISEQRVSHLLATNQLPLPEQRLPLIEMCLPVLKRRPFEDIERLLNIIEQLVSIDGRIDSFEYCLSRLVSQTLTESRAPAASVSYGKKRIADCVPEISTAMSILAAHGQMDLGSQGIQNAQSAYRAGMSVLDIHHTNLVFSNEWQIELDQALEKLDELKPNEKLHLVNALSATINADQQVVTVEQELLRAMCALIHVPLPLIKTTKAD